MPDQDAHQVARRQQIIDGAGLVFTECGYEGASMSRIALQASVSKGTLYNYFTSKSQLFAAFVEETASRTLIQVFEPIGEQEEIGTTLRGIALRMLELMLSPGNLVLYRTVIAEAGKFPHLAQIYWDTGPQRALAHMSSWLTLQMQAGRLRDTDPRFAAEQFFALCQARLSMRRLLQIEQDSTPEERGRVVDGAVRLFLGGYGQAGPATAAGVADKALAGRDARS